MSIIRALPATVLGIVLSVISKIILEGTDLSSIPTIQQNLLEVAPAVPAAVGVIATMGALIGAEPLVRTLKWNTLGNRIKEAYKAKFGYENLEFNKEVDLHIKAVKALGRGYTKSLDTDWLKIMCSFVEVPFIVPEEEKIPEVNKTEKFSEYPSRYLKEDK